MLDLQDRKVSPLKARPPGRQSCFGCVIVSWCKLLLCCTQATSFCTDTSVTKVSTPSRRRSPVSHCRTEDTLLSVALTTSEAASASSVPTCTTAPPCPTRKRRRRRRCQPAPPALLLPLLRATNSPPRCSEGGWLVWGCWVTKGGGSRTPSAADTPVLSLERLVWSLKKVFPHILYGTSVRSSAGPEIIWSF